MGRFNAMVLGAVEGAMLMYFFDPQQGRRRRAYWSDQLNRLGREMSWDFDVAKRDLSNRLQGTLAEANSLLSSDQPSDDVLAQRIRSKLGRLVTHAGAIEVDVSEGRVQLRGPVLSDEVQPLVKAVRWLHGVRHVDNQLDVHDSPDVPSLQGSGRIAASECSWMQGRMSPGTRLATGAAGSVLMLNCLASRSAVSLLWGTLGFGLLTRALSTSRMLGSQQAQSGTGSGWSGGHSGDRSSEETRSSEPSLEGAWPRDTSNLATQGGRSIVVPGEEPNTNGPRPLILSDPDRTASQLTGPAPFTGTRLPKTGSGSDAEGTWPASTTDRLQEKKGEHAPPM